ncbi:MAG TPA: hypothetical protein VIL78_20100 [Hanamia sp.]
MKKIWYLFLFIFPFFFNTLLAQQNLSEKQLNSAWLKSLYAKAERIVYKGDQLKTIGMPGGGIGWSVVYQRRRNTCTMVDKIVDCPSCKNIKN